MSFKGLRKALLLLPILSVGFLAGCTAQVGTPEDSTAQTEQLTNTTPTLTNVDNASADRAAVPAHIIDAPQQRALSPKPPKDPGQVESGNPNDPDPSPWMVAAPERNTK